MDEDDFQAAFENVKKVTIFSGRSLEDEVSKIHSVLNNSTHDNWKQRMENLSMVRSLLVAGADSGQLRLFSHPASQPQCGHHQYGGHSSAVSSLAFLADQSRLVSVGGKDAAILQWQIE